jgi:hypothetical protein
MTQVKSRRDGRWRSARAKAAANGPGPSRAAKQIRTPGGAAMRNRCPGATRWAGETAPEGLIRLSAGLEPAADLIGDIDDALGVLECGTP